MVLVEFCTYGLIDNANVARDSGVAHFSLRRVRVAPGYLEGPCDLFRMWTHHWLEWSEHFGKNNLLDGQLSRTGRSLLSVQRECRRFREG